MVHRTRIVSAAATLSLLLFAAAAPSSGAEQPDNTWVAESLEGVGIIASVNGLVTHGDRFIVRLSARNCGVGVTWFSFYTHAMNPDLPALKGKTIPALANGERIKIRINGSSKFLVGRIVYMSMGIFRLKALVGKLKGAENLTIRLLDTDAFKASEYFHVRRNIWSLQNFPEAVAKAQGLCEQRKGKKPKPKPKRPDGISDGGNGAVVAIPASITR